ncbi:hypothetical protein VFPPC_08742 [Pochonia chlamydosporia 170]|uniref:Uncharacterized protein n=1 Tax=Pochonia chlamydosporia 170 TaxID=1380566 RepID=A0A179FBF3_METCM|nr:hypothetical protein VFPPC_08742 [Pochonia chlamydosporia 170]OAQ62794.1 hypothetical protein VFPPC_08742 [Pochonia chlamydosporia 170]
MLFRRMAGGLVSLLCFTLSSLPIASTTGVTGAYERIGPLYQTYRIAVATWTAKQTKILPGLAELGGSHPNGGANFREMINFIDYGYEDGNGLTEDWYKEHEIDLNDPEPHKTAVEMDYFGKTGNIDLGRLFAGNVALWSDAISRIRTVLKSANDEMKEKGKISDLDHYRDRLEVCHKEILKLRGSDMVGGSNGKKALVQAIKKKWTGALVEVKVEDWEHDSTVRIFSLDENDIVAKSPPGLFTVEEVKAFTGSYGTNEQDSGVAKNHFSVIKEHETTKDAEKEWRAKPNC